MEEQRESAEIQANWCCWGLEGLASEAGERGFGFFVDRYEPETRFILQHRAMEPGTKPPHTDSLLSLVSELVIERCPWCGCSLLERYARDLPALDRSDLAIRIEADSDER